MRAPDTDFCDSHFKREGAYVEATEVLEIATNGSKADVALCGDCLDAAIRPVARKTVAAATRSSGRKASARLGRPAKKRNGRKYPQKACKVCGKRTGNMYMHFKGDHPELDYNAYAKASA